MLVLSIFLVQIHDTRDQFAALERLNFGDDLRDAFVPERQRGDVRGDCDTWVTPKTMFPGQRLNVEHIEHRTGQLACIERGDQILIDQVCAPCQFDKDRAIGQV